MKAHDSVSLVATSESNDQMESEVNHAPSEPPGICKAAKMTEEWGMDLRKLYQLECSQPRTAVPVGCFLLETGC